MDDMKARMLAIADELRITGGETLGSTGGGSLGRGLPEELRRRFIDLRTELFRRGVFDPVLVRFDTATVPLASNGEIAAELTTMAEGM